jgi:hypothetical protein
MDEVIKKGKKLGEGQKQAESAKISKQNAAREKKAAAVASRLDKNSSDIKARIDAQRAARTEANKPKPRVTRKQGKAAKTAFPTTQTVDEFVGLKQLTDSIRFRTSYKF